MVCLEILGNDELGEEVKRERVSAQAAAARESELGWFHEREVGSVQFLSGNVRDKMPVTLKMSKGKSETWRQSDKASQ